MNGKDDDRMKKYELTNEIKNLPGGVVLYRIRALRNMYFVDAGELGGFVQSEQNLDHDGEAWVTGDAMVYGNATVKDTARVSGNATVSENATVAGNAWVCGNAKIHGNAEVFGDASVFGDSDVCGEAILYGEVCIDGNAEISKDGDYAEIQGFGRSYRSTTFFRCKDGLVRVCCGCFYGDLDEFRERVQETHWNNKMGREYLMIADLMELHFKKE